MPIQLPPTPPRRFPGEFIFAFRKDPLALFERLVKAHGDAVHVPLGPERLVLLNDPELIKDVFTTHAAKFHKSRGLEFAKHLLGEGLLTSEEGVHLRQRRLIQPAFHKARIAGFAQSMVEHAERTSARWQHGVTLDLSREMMRLTLGIVGATLFSVDVESEAKEVGEALDEVIARFADVTLPFINILIRLPLPRFRRFFKARERLDQTIYRIIAEHRARPAGEAGDLLGMLMAARDEDDGSSMTDVQLRDEVMTLFLAGHETTANALTWMFYLLSQNPEAEREVHAEVDAVLNGRPPAAEDYSRLPLCRAAFAEAMRLYPPAWIIGRRAIEEVTLGPWTLPPRTTVMALPWLMHRDARYYPSPERFDLSRWTPEAMAARPRYTYFPFGGGVRQCIGEGFAWMEGVMVLATLARHWQARLVPGHPVVPQPLITLRAAHGMRMVCTRRQPASAAAA